jgi:hypothetical protein
MRPPLFWDFTQHRLVFSYRRFGTTYRSNLQRSSPKTPEDGTERLFRKSITSYQITLRNSSRQQISVTERRKHEITSSVAKVMLDKFVAGWRSGKGVEEDTVRYCKWSISHWEKPHKTSQLIQQIAGPRVGKERGPTNSLGNFVCVAIHACPLASLHGH